MLEPIETLNERIESGRGMQTLSHQIHFSLEPTLVLALNNYLLRNHGDEIGIEDLIDLDLDELIDLFRETTDLNQGVVGYIVEVSEAIEILKTVAYAERVGIEVEGINRRRQGLENINHYFDLVEHILDQLLARI